MFNWLRRILRGPGETFFEAVDRINAASHGGRPLPLHAKLGTLTVPTRSITLQDPQGMPLGLGIANLASNTATFSAELLRYPNGAVQVATLHISFSEYSNELSEKLVSEIGIDSAKIVVADTEAAIVHWAETGTDRIGEISTARDQRVHQLLKKQFKLRTRQVDALTAEIVGPVSEQLEREIVDYLKSFPEFASFPFIYFSVRTNDSFRRVNFMKGAWLFLPVGNDPEPIMFSCETGRGDCVYKVYTRDHQGLVVAVRIPFIEDLSE